MRLQNADVLIWMLIAVLAMLGGGFLAFRRQTRPALPGGQASAGLLERTVVDVRTNDVVQHDGRDYLVEGVVKYDEDGHTWSAARMVDGGHEHWLLVGLERGAALTVRMLARADKLELSGYPPETLEVGGTSYKLSSRGTATATFSGDLAGMPSAGQGDAAQRCRWWKYQAAGEKVLLVEQWGETYRALAGETVRPDAVELLGAS
jgi:hypothetical protein